MRNKIDTTNWKDFYLKDLFIKKTIKGYPQARKDCIPDENGYYVYGQNIKRQINEKVLLDNKYLCKVDPNHPILAYSSSVGEIGMINESFYRSGDNGAFQGLFPINKNLSEYVILFILSILKISFNNFKYDTSMTNIMEIKLKLPIDKKGNPNWNYMEQYMKSIEEKAQKRIDNFKNKKENKNKVDTTNWREFILEELFDIKNSKAYHKKDVVELDSNSKEDKINYVTRSKFNNGIKCQVKKTKDLVINPKNTISFGAENADFFFQENEYITGNKMYYIDTSKLSKETCFFIKTILQKTFTENYSFSDGMIPERIRDKKIKLPAIYNLKLKKYEPDWKYMEEYMKFIEEKAKGNKIRMKDYYNYNYEEKDIEEYIESKKGNFYGFDGLGNCKNGYPTSSSHPYKFHKEDISFENNTITINIGDYANKKLDYLLKELFIPRDEMCFDLKKAIEINNSKLILFNNVGNQSKDFFEYINKFFKDYYIDIEKQGIWE